MSVCVKRKGKGFWLMLSRVNNSPVHEKRDNP